MIITFIISIAICQIGLYLLSDRLKFKYGKHIIFSLILLGHFFIFPGLYISEPSKTEAHCGMAVMGKVLSFWLFGSITTVITHFIYKIKKL